MHLTLTGIVLAQSLVCQNTVQAFSLTGSQGFSNLFQTLVRATLKHCLPLFVEPFIVFH